MKDNKLYKVLRIIFLTLAIISLVFTLCKKVGLCASSSPLPSGSYPCPEDSSEWPFHIGSEFGLLSSDLIENCISYAFSHKTMDNSRFIVFVREYDQNNGSQINVSIYTNYKVRFVFNSYTWYDSYFQYYDGSGYDVYLNSSDFSIIGGSSRNASYNAYLRDLSEASPTGGRIVLTGQAYEGYILYSNLDEIYLDSSSSYGANLLAWKYFPNDSGVNFENGEVTSLPSFDTLPGNVTSTDDQQTLFDKLKGWLSTLSGNIQKGFKNIEENLTSFFKPYLDNIKGFFEWVTEPFDPEAASDSLEAIQAISDIRALNNVIGTSGIFDWDDVTPASRVAFTFDFGGSVLPHHEYEINFDWYTGTVKTLILSILVTFLVVGLLVTIINNIPSMIHGHSGDSGGGSN